MQAVLLSGRDRCTTQAASLDYVSFLSWLRSWICSRLSILLSRVQLLFYSLAFIITRNRPGRTMMTEAHSSSYTTETVSSVTSSAQREGSAILAERRQKRIEFGRPGLRVNTCVCPGSGCEQLEHLAMLFNFEHVFLLLPLR